MRVARRLLHVLVIVLTLIVGATAAAVIVSQTAWFKTWLRGYIVREANQYLNGTLSIQRLGGNLFFGVELENVALSMDGSQVVAVKDLGLDYNVFELIAKGLSVDDIRIDQPRIYLRREGDTWSITRLVKKQRQEADRSGPSRPISIDQIDVTDGALVIDGPVGTSGVEVPKRVEHLDAKLAFKYEPVRYTIEIGHVSFRGSDPAIAVNALSGGVAVHDDAVHVNHLVLRTAESSLSVDGALQQYLTRPTFTLQVTSDKLSLPEISRLVPALAGVPLQPAFEVKLDGPLDRLGVDLNVRSSAGQIAGNLVADVMAPGQSVQGTLAVRHLDLAPIVRNPAQKSDITAHVRADVRSDTFSNLNALTGTVALSALRVTAAGYEARNVNATAQLDGRRVTLDGSARAYGASATAAGRVTIPQAKEPLAFDVHGEVRGLDLRRQPNALKAPPAASDVNARYHVAGTVASGPNATQAIAGAATFLESTVAGARIEPGSRVGFSMKGKLIGYNADVTLSNIDLEQIGQEFKVPSLATDRYASTLNVHVTATGRGIKPEEMNLTAVAAFSDSTLLGGRIPNLAVDATVADNTAHVKANGAFAQFDPAVATGKPAMKGTVGGTLAVDAKVAQVSKGVTIDSVQATARVALDRSTIGGLNIDRAAVDGDYHDSTGDIRQLEIVGHDVNVQAKGTLALNDTGQSNLTFHADTPSLEEIGKLVDKRLTGIAKVDGTVTGNRRELQAAGHVTGDGVRYGDNGALTLSTDYSVRVPDLTFARANVSATTHATFVTVGGQNISEFTAKAEYDAMQVTFDATARQPQRSAKAAGDVVLHPDHQEVHLKGLALQAQGVQWQLAPGSAPAIQYGDNAVVVKDLCLVSGAQQIVADGTFGHPGDALEVTLKDVELATIDALLLRPPQFSGRLNASSTIGGTKDAPQVTGAFQVVQGGFRQFHYESFGGTVEYSGGGVTVDAMLQQTPSAWLTAKGYVPVAAFESTPAAARRSTHVQATAREDRFDLRVQSSPIDLGVVQGFTTALTNVKGTLRADVRVTGAAADPHPDGSITIQNAAFTVEPTGVSYTDLDGEIHLRPDGVHVSSISVVDDHGETLVVSGDLALHQREVGAVQVDVEANDFKVLDNKMGNVRVNTDLRLTGELARPRLEGDLGINTGMLNLDPILASVGESAYATKPVEYATGPASANSQGQTPPPIGFDALQMNVHLTVPDDLVVKGSDLKLPNAPIGLGATNMTIGGDLHAIKDSGSQVKLVGAVRTIRGWYDFQGRRFTLLRDGTIRFEGLTPPDPTLDIRTQRVIRGVIANVNIEGQMSKPQIVLSSVSPLDQADILALIVFNQPVNELGEGAQITLAQRAEQMAAGQIASALTRSIGDALKLSEFEIRAAPDSGAAAQLTVGEQMSPNLYVKVEQGIGDVSTTNFVLEYEVTDWLRLQTNLLEGASTQTSLFQRAQGSGADLIFLLSF